MERIARVLITIDDDDDHTEKEILAEITEIINRWDPREWFKIQVIEFEDSNEAAGEDDEH